MPSLGEISRFLGGQTFGKTSLPNVDLIGKTMVVTGSNTGLGFECAKHLVKLGLSRLILACRNVDKGQTAESKISQELGNNRNCQIEVWQVDMCNYQSVLAFIDRVNSSLPRLDGFIANAGVEMIEFELAEGLETTLTVNAVSTYLISIGLVPKLEESSKKYDIPTALTIVGSMIHTFGPDSQLEVLETQDILKALSDPETADMQNRYPLSKLIDHLYFHSFAQKVTTHAAKHAADVIINIVNPGWCASELDRYKVNKSLFERGMFAMIGRTAEEGSRTLVHAITAGKETHDHYLSECQIKPESEYMQSEKGRQTSRRLWRELLVRLHEISPEIAAIVQ